MTSVKISISLIEITQVHELYILEKSIKNRSDLKDADSWKTWRFGWSILQLCKHLTCRHPFEKQKCQKRISWKEFLCFSALFFNQCNFIYYFYQQEIFYLYYFYNILFTFFYLYLQFFKCFDVKFAILMWIIQSIISYAVFKVNSFYTKIGWEIIRCIGSRRGVYFLFTFETVNYRCLRDLRNHIQNNQVLGTGVI